jgi:hypothetical protein
MTPQKAATMTCLRGFHLALALVGALAPALARAGEIYTDRWPYKDPGHVYVDLEITSIPVVTDIPQPGDGIVRLSACTTFELHCSFDLVVSASVAPTGGVGGTWTCEVTNPEIDCPGTSSVELCCTCENFTSSVPPGTPGVWVATITVRVRPRDYPLQPPYHDIDLGQLQNDPIYLVQSEMDVHEWSGCADVTGGPVKIIPTGAVPGAYTASAVPPVGCVRARNVDYRGLSRGMYHVATATFMDNPFDVLLEVALWVSIPNQDRLLLTLMGQRPWTLTISSTAGGQVTTPGEGTSSYDHAATVNLVATPDAHHHFVGWTGPVADPTSASTTVAVTADTAVEAVFAIDQHTVVITSTAGGTVSPPGTGRFVYDYGTVLILEAQAAPQFEFAGWTGSSFDTSQRISVTVESDRQICANFISTQDTLRVSAGTDGDPNTDGTGEHPFNSIQAAIEVAREGTRILVDGGTYHGRLDFMGKSVRVEGLWLSDPNVTDEPVIDGAGVGPVVTFSGGEDANCVVAGLRIQGGNAPYAAAIRCSGSPTIMNCLIAGNRSLDQQGAVIDCAGSNAVFINCTITENAAEPQGALLTSMDSHVMLINSILWGNTPSIIRTVSGAAPTLIYCDVDADPAFVQTGAWTDAGIIGWPCDDLWSAGDYHLQSQAGHWDAVSGTYIKDAASSPCIDAGDPASDYAAERVPNGSRINLGFYGGTGQASLSPE